KKTPNPAGSGVLIFGGEAGRIWRVEKLMSVQLPRPEQLIRVEPPRIDWNTISETLTNMPEKTSLGEIFFDKVNH
ncbi:MAG: hypothetical protein ABFS42_14700, partial [Candidatus Krumholzibacteriota bacterium]